MFLCVPEDVGAGGALKTRETFGHRASLSEQVARQISEPPFGGRVWVGRGGPWRMLGVGRGLWTKPFPLRSWDSKQTSRDRLNATHHMPPPIHSQCLVHRHMGGLGSSSSCVREVPPAPTSARHDLGERWYPERC